MHAPPPIRSTFKWIATSVTVLLIALWIASARWELAAARANVGAGFSAGQFWFYRRTRPIAPDPGAPPTEWRLFERRDPSWHGWWFHRAWPLGFSWYTVPVWILAATTLVPATIAWRLDARARRRARIGRCRVCGYDRRGLAAAALCPECGAPPNAGDQPP